MVISAGVRNGVPHTNSETHKQSERVHSEHFSIVSALPIFHINYIIIEFTTIFNNHNHMTIQPLARAWSINWTGTSIFFKNCSEHKIYRICTQNVNPFLVSDVDGFSARFLSLCCIYFQISAIFHPLGKLKFIVNRSLCCDINKAYQSADNNTA